MKISNNDLLNKFYTSSRGNSSALNFDLKELINNFDFYDFIVEGSKKDSRDFSAFFVLTNKQYILGYTAGFGEGTHQSAFGRTMLELSGGGTISNYTDLMSYSSKCYRKHIVARIVYEKSGEDEFGRNKYYGSMHFVFPNRKINKEEFEMFKQFCEDYDENIKLGIKKSNNSFHVSYEPIGNQNRVYVTSLYDVLEYMSENLDLNLEIQPSNEVIIGKEKRELRIR